MEKYKDITIEEIIKIEEDIERDGITIVVQSSYYESIKRLNDAYPNESFQVIGGYYGTNISNIKPFTALTKSDFTPIIVHIDDDESMEEVIKKLKKLRLKNLFRTRE